MLKGIDINQRVEFISTKDTDEPKTVFVLRPLTGSEMLDVSKYITDGKLSISGDFATYVLGNAIVEIKNPDLKEKEEIQTFIKKMTTFIITELISEVTRLNNLSDDEAKN